MSNVSLMTARGNPRIDVDGYYHLFAGNLEGFNNRFFDFSKPFSAPELTLADLSIDAILSAQNAEKTLSADLIEALSQLRQANLNKHFGTKSPLYVKSTFNLSVSGVCISSEQAYHPETDVVVSFYFLEAPHGPLHVQGQVVRSEWGRKGRYDVKIRFSGLSVEQTKLISTHVERSLQKQKVES